MNYQIRNATEQDAEEASRVLQRSITECCVADHRNDPALLDPWRENKTPRTVQQWLGSASNFSIVAEYRRSVVGVAMMRRGDEILLLYLLPEVRFAGMGKALLNELESKARDMGAENLRLTSTTTALSFYTRNGFVLAESHDKCVLPHCYPMRKPLRVSAVRV